MRRTKRSPLSGWSATLLATTATLLAVATALLVGSTAAQAAPAATPTQSQSAYLADRLRHSPIYLSDQLPRVVPRSTAPEFAAEARRLRVPTYVVVLPFLTSGGLDSGLLAGVHDHLGRKGLYVAVSETGLSDVQSYGVSVPGAADAKTATLYELPYDATPREVFRHFVDLLASGQAHQRAEKARATYGGAYNRNEPPALHTTQTDRQNQSFLTGVVIAGGPLSALLIANYALTRRRSGANGPRGTRSSGGAKGPGGTPAPGCRGPRKGVTLSKGTAPSAGGYKTTRPGPLPAWSLPLGALALAALLAFGASRVFDATSTGDGSVPTAADMRARVDRVAEGLRHDPLYVDPESASPLDAAQRAGLRRRIRSLPVPVLVVALPSSLNDESAGNKDELAQLLHDRLRRDALYVLAELPSGGLWTANYGTHLDTSTLYDEARDSTAAALDGSTLGPRLDRLLASVAKAKTTKTAGEPFAPLPVQDPAAQRKLPGLFTGDFHPGLFIGALGGLLLFGVVAAVSALVRRLIRRRAGAAAGSVAPVEPKQAWLRHTARREVDALTAELEPATGLPEAARRRAWECLDAAALLIDGDSDGRIDADATPAGLACAIVLARAGRAAVRAPNATAHVCCRNPLHGAATERERGGGRGQPARPVCAACRETPGAVLRLSGPVGSGRRGPTPYPDHPGPLASLAKGAGIDQLTREVRESFGVN
ncbi:hypothetical protein ACIQU6_21085 [Streptomyces sp. NPDC090442]|uniref:hypothetical protein n=1 Tax=Streptomyces sp. NPDC090442 TaxID=3365962 RepID=UPI003818FFED